MGWRIVDVSQSSRLDYKCGYLVARDCESTTRIHLDEVNIVVVSNNATTITSPLLAECAERQIDVVFCDAKHNPVATSFPLYGSCENSLKIHAQLAWQETTKQCVWTSIVRQKILMQAACLRCFQRPEAELLDKYVDELELNDPTNREGHASKVYFNALFGPGFARRENTPVNAALNYGYGILLSIVNREVVSNGYLTQLGIFHDNRYNRFNLSCDLMEPFRPFVDRFVKEQGFMEFDSEHRRLMLSLFSGSLTITGRKQSVINTIRIYVKSVFAALQSNDVSLIQYYEYGI